MNLFNEIEQARDKKKLEEKEKEYRTASLLADNQKAEPGNSYKLALVSKRGDYMMPNKYGVEKQIPVTSSQTKGFLASSSQKDVKRDFASNLMGGANLASNTEGKIVYKGYAKGKRGGSNEPTKGPKLTLDALSSPKKGNLGLITGGTSTSRKGPSGKELYSRPDFLSQNLINSPGGVGNGEKLTASKKKGFGFLGLKFLSKNGPPPKH